MADSFEDDRFGPAAVARLLYKRMGPEEALDSAEYLLSLTPKSREREYRFFCEYYKAMKEICGA